MASRKKPTKKPPKKTAPSGPALYLGCFQFDEPGELNYDGTFQMVVQASTPKQAVDRFRARLRKLRTTATLFDSPVTIYMEGFIALRGAFEDGLLVNWESGQSPTAPHARITCLIPEQDDTDAEGYGFGSDEDGPMEPFLDFGGKTVARALAAARTAAGNAPGVATQALPAHIAPPKMSAEERRRLRDEAQALKQQRAAEREAKKKHRVAVQESKKRRALLVGETLAELGTAKRPSARS